MSVVTICPMRVMGFNKGYVYTIGAGIIAFKTIRQETY